MLDNKDINQQQEVSHVNPSTEQSSQEQPKQIFEEMSDLALKVTEIQGKISKFRKDKRQYLSVTLFLVLIDISVTIFRKGIFDTNDVGYYTVFWLLMIIAILLGIAALGVQGSITSLQADISVITTRANIISIFSDRVPEKPKSYFDSLVQINVENLAAYYTLVKVHTDKSFLVSIIAGAIGFMLIIVGLVAGFTTSTNVIAYMTSGSGIFTEFIAAIFFYLHNRNVAQMKNYHDSLLSVQNILLAFKLVEDTQDETEKAKMVGQILTYLMGEQGTAIKKK